MVSYLRTLCNARDGWLERIFVTRSVGVIEHIHHDPARRRLIYQLGLPPRRCTSFLVLANTIELQLREALGYAKWTADKRFDFLSGLAHFFKTILPFASATHAID